MRSLPAIHDQSNPLISIIVQNYDSNHLGQLLTDILLQDAVKNIEILYMHGVAPDGAWEVANRFAKEYEGIITLHRNTYHDVINDIYYAYHMSQGKYLIILAGCDIFEPEYISNCITVMEDDPLAKNTLLVRRYEFRLPRKQYLPKYRRNLKDNPMVNVLVHNFNYGEYLRQCLDSLFAQTYDNVRIIFSDNCSTDASWEIAVEYAIEHPDSMTLIRNRTNFGPGTNLENCYHHLQGKYFCILCSDDAYDPHFLERCVSVMEENNNVGLTLTHRAILDQEGQLHEEPPFYDTSCIIPGQEQAAVYMMAAVNPCISQVFYHLERVETELPVGNILAYNWYAQRFLDFNLCTQFDMAYIKDPLLLNRVHDNNDTSKNSASLVELFSQYILAHQFAEIAANHDGMSRASNRLPGSVKKVGKLCPRYAVHSLLNNDEKTAYRYYHLGIAIFPEIEADETYVQLKEYWIADASRKVEILKTLSNLANLTARNISYEPPPGATPITFPG